jgi:large subunit ribosomal protein L9
MKVILLQDVAKLGRRYTIVDVPDGYGVNKLIPKGLAKPATPENVKAVMARSGALLHNKEAAEAAFKELCAALEGKSVTLTAEANAEGRFFQAVKPEAIANAVSDVSGKKVGADQIAIAEPIKAVGEYVVTLSLAASHAPLTIAVTARA